MKTYCACTKAMFPLFVLCIIIVNLSAMILKKIFILSFIIFSFTACRPDEEGIPAPEQAITLSGKGYHRWLTSSAEGTERYEEIVFDDSLSLTMRSFNFHDSLFTDTLTRSEIRYNYHVSPGSHTIRTAPFSGNNYKDAFQYYDDSLYIIDDINYSIPLKRFR